MACVVDASTLLALLQAAEYVMFVAHVPVLRNALPTQYQHCSSLALQVHDVSSRDLNKAAVKAGSNFFRLEDILELLGYKDEAQEDVLLHKVGIGWVRHQAVLPIDLVFRPLLMWLEGFHQRCPCIGLAKCERKCL